MLYASDYSQMDISTIRLKIAETKKKKRFITNQMLYVINFFLFQQDFQMLSAFEEI